jgi:hypothetical protein
VELDDVPPLTGAAQALSAIGAAFEAAEAVVEAEELPNPSIPSIGSMLAVAFPDGQQAIRAHDNPCMFPLRACSCPMGEDNVDPDA